MKLLSKIKNILYPIRNMLIAPKFPCEQVETNKNMYYFCKIKRKYKKKLKNFPLYNHTNIYSNKVWWCWLQGEENAPDLQKVCLSSLRKCLIDREIIVITENNIFDYVKFPQFIIDKYNKGIISKTHFSDLIRLELLINYGGTWIDSSVYCTKYNKSFFDKELFVFKSFMRGDSSIAASNWFITSEVKNPILLTTLDLLYDYWKNNNRLMHYYIFHFFFKMATEKYEDDWEKISMFNNISPHVMQFELLNDFNENRYKELTMISDIHKLNHKLDFDTKNYSLYKHLIKNKGDKVEK